jgi:glycosyltransferase involved in cell wall biosynthesis
VDVSLIATVKNEESSIAGLLDSILAQSRRPDEIVINDNGSTDGTVAIIERYIAAGDAIRLVHGGTNIPSGRNNAIRHARGPLIASCDAGLTLPRDWLAEIVAPLEDGAADVAGGFYVPAPESLWELALGATNYRDVDEVDPRTFLPGGLSVAFRKAAWEAVGGFPEWADACEDLLFDIELKRRGYRFTFVPTAAVLLRPRSSLGAYVRQYYAYSRGDGVGRLMARRHAARYAYYAGLMSIGSLARGRSGLWALVAALVAVHLQAPLRRAWRRSRGLPASERLIVGLLVPVIRFVGDMAKMIGYPVGVARRLRGRGGVGASRATAR